MSFFIEDSGLIVTHVLYKTAVIIAVLRWILAWILRYRSRSSGSGSRSRSASSSCPSSSCPLVSSQAIKDSLAVATFGDVVERSPAWISETCAVCLSTLEDDDEVRELGNCRHVFHRECIDRWLDYECGGAGGDDHDGGDDNHRTCPLCRAPLLIPTTTSCTDWPAKNEPSWAVERLLYLFGDDLLA